MVMAAVVAVMHEEVHERAGKHEEIRQDAEHMCRMLRQKEEAGDGGEAQRHKPGARAIPRRALGMIVFHPSAGEGAPYIIPIIIPIGLTTSSAVFFCSSLKEA